MTDNRKSGIALIAGSVGGMLTMAIHPTGASSLSADQIGHLATLSGIAHSLALVSILLLFLGACGLVRKIAYPDRLAFAGIVTYAFACVAIMIAGAVSGFIVPDIMRHMTRDVPEAAPQWHIVIDGVFQFNQAFARIFSVAASLAMVLCMGTATHTQDFALIEPALRRLKAEYGDRLSIDILGMTDAPNLAPGINRIAPSPHAVRSYPGFVQWLTSAQPSWHIGLAPLEDTAFTRCKSPIKTLDYAAMGLAVLASDTPVYQGSIADGVGGTLVPNNPDAWHAALEFLIRNRDQRRTLATRAADAFNSQGTLLSHAAAYRDALKHALDLRHTRRAA